MGMRFLFDLSSSETGSKISLDYVAEDGLELQILSPPPLMLISQASTTMPSLCGARD